MIPFLDLQAQYRGIGPELEAAALEVLRRGEYILGSRVTAFEANFAAYCGGKGSRSA
jgi:dTDP-4-amino-4,6-dideoxygalactose transaminase